MRFSKQGVFWIGKKGRGKNKMDGNQRQESTKKRQNTQSNLIGKRTTRDNMRKTEKGGKKGERGGKNKKTSGHVDKKGTMKKKQVKKMRGIE